MLEFIVWSWEVRRRIRQRSPWGATRWVSSGTTRGEECELSGLMDVACNVTRVTVFFFHFFFGPRRHVLASAAGQGIEQGSLYGGVKSGRDWRVRQHQNLLFTCKYTNQFINSRAQMARIRSRKTRARHFTPPPDLACTEGQIKTPQRCGVLYAKLYSQELGIPIPQSLIRKVTGVAERI